MRGNAFLTGAWLPFRSASRLALMLPALLLLITVIAPSPLMAQRNVSAEQSALGFTGKVNDDLWTVNFLRQNALLVNGRSVPPALVLEGYVTFQFTGTSNGRNQALVFGEFPLLQRDVERFKTALVQGGVDIAALHNHELFEVPRWLFVHVEAFGDAQSIAGAIRTALVSTAASYKDITNEDVDLPGKVQVKSTMPSDAVVQGREGVIDVQLDRRESFTSCENAITSLTSTTAGTTLNTGTSTTDLTAGDLNASALATCRAGTGQIKLIPAALAFSDITVDWRGGSGTVDADLALLTNEVNPVLRFLESKGFRLSALHNHALTVRPEVFFLHASAEGDVISALQAIRTAWDATGGRTTTTSP